MGDFMADNDIGAVSVDIIPNSGISSLNALCLNLSPYPLSLKERGIRG